MSTAFDLFWIGLGIFGAGWCIGVGISEAGEHIAGAMKDD